MDFEKDFNALLIENDKLIRSIADKYKGHDIPFEELVCSGQIGLWMATKSFDKNAGVKFSTYAYYYIQNEIEINLDEVSGLSKYENQNIRKFKKAESELTQELNRKPSDKEISEKLDMPIEKIQELRRLSQQNISLNNTIDGESDSTIADLIPNETMSPEEQLIYNEEQNDSQIIKDAFLKTLLPYEKVIYHLRIEKEKNVTDIAKEFHVTRKRVTDIVKQINDKKNAFFSSDEYYNITNGKTDNLLKRIIEEQYKNIDISKKETNYAEFENYDNLTEIDFKVLAKRFNDEYAINLSHPTFDELFTKICEQKGINESNFQRATKLSESEFKTYKTKRATPSISAIVSLGIYFSLGINTVDGLLESAGYRFKKNDRTHLAYTFVLEQLKGYPIQYCNKVLELLGVEKKYLLNQPKKGKRKKNI